MKIHFLGTNGWYSSITGDTPCIVLDAKDFYAVLDAGNGIYKLDQLLVKDKPIYLFISHFHIDHVSGFHILNKFTFKQGLDIYVPSIKKEAFDTLVNPPFTIPIDELRMRVEVCPLPEGKHDSPFKLTVKELFHAYKSFGYRFEIDGKIICYSGDTGVCDNSYSLFKDADVLIHECSNYIGVLDTKKWGHVNPEEAAKLAKDCNVKKLILTHFGANQFDSPEKRREAEKAAQEIFPDTIAAEDGLEIEV